MTGHSFILLSLPGRNKLTTWYESLLTPAPTALALHGLVLNCVCIIHNQSGIHSAQQAIRRIETITSQAQASWKRCLIGWRECQIQNKVKSSLGLAAISLKVLRSWRGLKMFLECEVKESSRLPSKEGAVPCTLTCGIVLCWWDSLLSPCGFWITFKTWLSLAMVFQEVMLWFSN